MNSNEFFKFKVSQTSITLFFSNLNLRHYDIYIQIFNPTTREHQEHYLGEVRLSCGARLCNQVLAPEDRFWQSRSGFGDRFSFCKTKKKSSEGEKYETKQ